MRFGLVVAVFGLVPACGRVGFAPADAGSSDTQARCDVVFRPAVSYPGGTRPTAIAIGDIDGDLRPDVLVAATVTNEVRVHLNGSLGVPAIIAVPGRPADLAVADVNGDGRDDLLVSHENNGLCVFTNDGAGGLGPCVSRVTSMGPNSLATGRIDGDPARDIVVGNQISGSLGVFINDGSGGFAGPSNYNPGGSNPVAESFVDLDGDGADDLVVVNLLSDNVAVLHGDNTESLGPLTTYATGPVPGSLAIRDLDGDAIPDVVVGTDSSIEVLRGAAGATLLPGVAYATGTQLPFPLTRPVVLGDFDRDGSIDVATTNRTAGTIGVFMNQQDGTFSSPINVPVGGDADRLATADLDGDGILDLIVTSTTTHLMSVLAGSCR